MRAIRFSQMTALLFSLFLLVGPADATMDHTYVSGTGSDSGGCTSPSIACRTFAYAIGQTSAYGDIIAINAADYGPVSITKSINLIAQAAGPAGVTVGTGNAITISAGTGDVVNLRGLTLDGDQTASSGIVLSSAGSLTISGCFIYNFKNTGILLTPSNYSAGNVSILNSVLNNNGAGLTIRGSGDFKTFVTVRNVVANYNGTGFSVTGATMTFADSMATGNTEYGILIGPIGGDVDHSALLSYGDNEINGNGTDVSGGTLGPPLAKQ